MSSSSRRIVGRHGLDAGCTNAVLALHDIASTRAIEHATLATLPAHTLMERAGLEVARLALALAPHAHRYWIACGPGNNGGDGLVAARYLQQWGKQVYVSMFAASGRHPDDASHALAQAQEAGVSLHVDAPTSFDCAIDALFGIGNIRELPLAYSQWVDAMNHASCPVISVDLPSGLHADTGVAAAQTVRASHTLSLLTLKPGLFTASGRDQCGDIWFNSLGCTTAHPATLTLNTCGAVAARQHNSHKGSYGDVAVVGGAPSMEGAAHLSAHAALRAGAGRVYLCLLDVSSAAAFSTPHELMLRPVGSMDWRHYTVVAGCGAGPAITDHLESILAKTPALVLDADALNAMAASKALRDALRRRQYPSTVMTPHPLEAARLLQSTTAAVQADRIAAAGQLAQDFACTVVLKGSGSVIATPNHIPGLNPTGNARLATAGTGDVLAGMIGSALANGLGAHTAACHSVLRHGAMADAWPAHTALTASALVQAL